MAFMRSQAGKDAELVGIGLSLGANTLLKIAGQQKENFPLKAIVSVNNPFDVWCAINLMRGTVYEKHLCKELRKKMVMRDPNICTEREWKVYSEMIKLYKLNYDKLNQMQTWRDLDEEFTLKVHPQFKCTAAYYNAASCLEHVEGITVPTLVIHSQDDPVVPVDCVPIEECLANENVVCAITRRGSHVCYFMQDGKHRWFTHASSEFLQNSL